MARKRTYINPKCGDNLKALCKEMKITQTKLAETTGFTQNTISKIINHHSPLTDYVAKKIVEYYPSFRYEWLMGFDDKPHEVYQLYIPGILDVSKYVASAHLLGKCGVVINQVTPGGVKLSIESIQGILSLEWPIEIEIAGKVLGKYDARSVQTILLEICDFAEFKIKKLCGEI